MARMNTNSGSCRGIDSCVFVPFVASASANCVTPNGEKQVLNGAWIRQASWVPCGRLRLGRRMDSRPARYADHPQTGRFVCRADAHTLRRVAGPRMPGAEAGRASPRPLPRRFCWVLLLRVSVSPWSVFFCRLPCRSPLPLPPPHSANAGRHSSPIAPAEFPTGRSGVTLAASATMALDGGNKWSTKAGRRAPVDRRENLYAPWKKTDAPRNRACERTASGRTSTGGRRRRPAAVAVGGRR
jgi:hypothetical protein